MQRLRVLLCFQHQLCRQQCLVLVLRHMRPVHNIAHKLRSERQHHIAAVDVLSLFLIHEKEVITALPTTNVDVFSDFDVALSSKYEESPIAPRSEALRSEPIHADVSSTPAAMKDHVAEILELRLVVVIYICNLRRCDIGHGRSGEVDELIRLMRSDVA